MLNERYFQRSDSVPRLYKTDLLDELGMDEVGGRRSAMSLADLEDSGHENQVNKAKVRNKMFP